MIVWPGLRRSVSAIRRLFNSASFYAPLTHSAIPTRAATGNTATFTRATTGSVQDHEGVLRTAIAGEARFTGARRVRNLLTTTSEDFTNGAWTKLNAGAGSVPIVTSGFTDPEGGDTAYRLQVNSGGSGGADYSILRNTLSTASVRLSSIWIKSNTGSSQVVGIGVLDVGQTVTATTEWQRLPILPYSSASNLFDISAYPAANGSDQNIDVIIWRAQTEDITGRADQTTPSEYVSVGVASAPYYHGSMVDGVKCFPNDLSGNPIPSTTLLGYSAEGARTNLCLQSNAFTTTWLAAGTPAATQDSIGPDGGTTAWTLTDNDGASAEAIYQIISLTAAAHTVSFFVAKTVGAQSAYPVVYSFAGGGGLIAPITVDTTNGIATMWSSYTGLAIASGLSASCTSYNDNFWRVALTYTATAENWQLTIMPSGTTNPVFAGPTIDSTAQGSAVFYGVQVELGSFASSYIATTTIAVARNADIDSTTTSGNITAAAGSVYLEFTPTHSPSGTVAFWGTYVDASNYTAILHDATNLIFRKRIAGINYDATIANAFVSGTTYKVCGTWGAAGVTITLNGTDGTPSADTTAAQIAATMQWGADGNSLQQPFASVRNCRDWLRQLSSSERRAITV